METFIAVLFVLGMMVLRVWLRSAGNRSSADELTQQVFELEAQSKGVSASQLAYVRGVEGAIGVAAAPEPGGLSVQGRLLMARSLVPPVYHEEFVRGVEETARGMAERDAARDRTLDAKLVEVLQSKGVSESEFLETLFRTEIREARQRMGPADDAADALQQTLVTALKQGCMALPRRLHGAYVEMGRKVASDALTEFTERRRAKMGDE